MYLTRGTVNVYTMIQGKRVELAVLQPSDFFGEIAFLTGKPRTATVEAARGDATCWRWPKKTFRDLIPKWPRIKQVLQKYYEERVKSTMEKVKGSAIVDPRMSRTTAESAKRRHRSLYVNR